MDLGLEGKLAIVTGGSKGIGLAIADELAAEGTDVVIAARTQHDLDQACDRIAHHGTRVMGIAVDTSQDASVRELVAKVVSEFGGVDILVNSAAEPATPGSPKALADLVDGDLTAEIETKVLGYLRTSRAVAPHMISQGWGRIINISGLAARQSGSTFGSMRNVAVAAMTKNLADELGPSGINVTVVHPGLTVTERTPGLIASSAAAQQISDDEAERRLASNISIRRLVTAAEIADVVTFLASPRSVSITGDAIAVGGGAVGAIYY